MTTALALAAMRFAAAHEQAPHPALFDGRYYEVVLASRINWEDARAAAEARSFQGVRGHLATIGSQEEDAFVQALRDQALGGSGERGKSRPRGGTELWAGGYQVKCMTTTPEPACGWVWINGAPIDAVNGDSPYTHWQNGEPNNVKRTADALHFASEDFLAIGLGGKSGWNDEGDLTNISGYVVEYGDKVTVAAETCTAGAGGCNPSGAQVFELPGTAQVAPDATLTASTFLFRDDPARCGNQTLTLFNGAVVIPAYLCGHPDFVVIKTETSGVTVPTGTIDVENLTEEVLPENLYGCTAVRQNPVGVVDPDPSHRDVVAWQHADPEDMLETALGAGRFLGTLAEVTYGCGSSRGRALNGSWYFVGLRIHPGAGNELAGNPEGNRQSFIDLTGYKLQLLRASVLASKPALSKAAFNALKCLIDKAIAQHNQGRFKEALATIRSFLTKVTNTPYQVIAGENFNGEHLMRASNLEFTYKVKVVPFLPPPYPEG